MDRHDGAELLRRRVDRRQARSGRRDRTVGLLDRRQPLARHESSMLRAARPRRGRRRLQAARPDDPWPARSVSISNAARRPRFRAGRSRRRQRIRGERPQPDLAAHAVRGADAGRRRCASAAPPAERQLAEPRRGRLPLRPWQRPAQPWRRRRGLLGLGGFFGLGLALLARHRLFRIVALRPLHDAGGSRKRITRSDGCAPLAIQALTLSRSSFSRSVLSFGSSGLK